MIAVHEEAGRIEGPAICDSNGYLLSYAKINEGVWTLLEETFDGDRHMFPNDVKEREDIRELVNIKQTFRRSSDSRAIAEGVKETDIDTVQRWRKKKRAKGKAPSESMRVGYSHQELLNKCFRRYTQAI